MTSALNPADKLAYSVKEAAASLGLSPKAVYNLIAAEDLQVRRIGRKILITRAALEAFLEGCEQ